MFTGGAFYFFKKIFFVTDENRMRRMAAGLEYSRSARKSYAEHNCKKKEIPKSLP
jgi:hypothetical protein